MASVDENFATAFASVPTSVNNQTEEWTSWTIYVKLGGVITPQAVNFDAQGDAIAREKRINTPKNTKSAYTPKALEFQGFCRSLYGATPADQFVTANKLFGFL